MAPAKYGPRESKARLEEQGFHSKVTKSSPAELVAIWETRAINSQKRPSREAFAIRQGLPRYTRSTLLLEPLFAQFKSQEEDSGLLTVLRMSTTGSFIAESLYSQGLGTVRNVALCSSSTWRALTENSNVWNFTGSCFTFQGHSGVYTVMSPQNPFSGTDLDDDVFAWQCDNEINRHIEVAREALRKGIKLGGADIGLSRSSLEALKTIPSGAATRARQLPEHRIQGVLDLNFIHLEYSLRSTLSMLAQRSAAVKVLYFEQTPFLDRRLLAVILRSLPHLTMLGVYHCPLLHFGDVIVVLDLIHEINRERRSKGQPMITGFDFAPNHEAGMPFQHARATTYGLTWGPESKEIVQRGFYMIIMKAFLKAKALRINLLFDEGKAFRNFLTKIPNIPLGVPSFLDALHRYMVPGTRKCDGSRKKAVFDLLQPVTVLLSDDWVKDEPGWYEEDMEKATMFCASCGYETFQEFFTGQARSPSSRSWSRVCAGCQLQQRLDDQPDHMKFAARDCLNYLFPHWKRSLFNLDAPIAKDGGKLIRLRSIATTQRPTAPERLLRDQNVLHVSIGNLPSLEQLVHNYHGPWKLLTNGCFALDVFKQSIHIAMDAIDPTDTSSTLYWQIKKLSPTGMIQHWEEMQHARRPEMEHREADVCHDFNSALKLQWTLQDKGLQTGPPGYKPPQSNIQRPMWRPGSGTPAPEGYW